MGFKLYGRWFNLPDGWERLQEVSEKMDSLKDPKALEDLLNDLDIDIADMELSWGAEDYSHTATIIICVMWYLSHKSWDFNDIKSILDAPVIEAAGKRRPQDLYDFFNQEAGGDPKKILAFADYFNKKANDMRLSELDAFYLPLARDVAMALRSISESVGNAGLILDLESCQKDLNQKIATTYMRIGIAYREDFSKPVTLGEPFTPGQG